MGRDGGGTSSTYPHACAPPPFARHSFASMLNPSLVEVCVAKHHGCMLLGGRMKGVAQQQQQHSVPMAGLPAALFRHRRCCSRKEKPRRVAATAVEPEELTRARKADGIGSGGGEDGDPGLAPDTAARIALRSPPLVDAVRTRHGGGPRTGAPLLPTLGLQFLQHHPAFTMLSSGLSPRVRGVLLLNILTFLYGSNIPVIKVAEKIVAPHLFSFGRFALAALAFSPFVWQGRKDKDVLIAGVELGCWISVGYLAQGVSLLTTDAGRASFISAFTMIVVPILAGLSGVKISKLTWGAAGVALIGVGLLESTGSPATVGDFWSLISALFFGIHMLRTEHYSRKLSSHKSFPLIGVELFIITLCSMVWFLFSMLQHDSSFDLQFTGLESFVELLIGLPWLPIIYTGLFSTALCLWIEVSVLRDVSASDAAIIYSLEPLWGAAFSWCFLGERWGALSWLGAFLILVGSVSVQLFGASSADAFSKKDTLPKFESILNILTRDAAAAAPPGKAEDLQKPCKESSHAHVVLGGSECVKRRRHG